jgi:N-acetylglucosamine kinase-like BadF-type ATPase
VTDPGHCVLAADGGNSKTDVVLADVDGRVLARVQVGGIVAARHGSGAAAQTLVEGAAAARAAAGLDLAAPLAAAVLAVANVDTAEEEDALRDELSAAGLAARVRVHNDTFAVLWAGSPDGWTGQGVAVVVGAGINAVGRDAAGRTHRFLALGEVSGDWGGGLSLGVAAVAAGVRAGDGRGPCTSLRALVPAHLGLPDPETVARSVDRGELDAFALLDLAPLVLSAAADGDLAATQIVTRLGDEAADFAIAALRGLDLTGLDVPVVLGGGLLQAGSPLLVVRIAERIRAVAPGAHVRVLDVAPVAGPLLEALCEVGAGSDARRRARAALVAS